MLARGGARPTGIIETELKPNFVRQKSFYGKATVKDNGRFVALFSYGTFIESFDRWTGRVVRSKKYNYSDTTKRHQEEFEHRFGIA